MVQRVELELADATLTETVRALANATGRPIAVDPAAQELASCMRVTVVSSGPATGDEVIGVVGRALEGSALTLERSPEGIVVRRVPGAAPPATCLPEVADRRTRPTETDRDRRRSTAADGVRRQNATTFLVTRAARDEAFGDAAATSRTVRVVPHVENGAVVGLKLFGIRRDSLPGLLGLQNGDTLQSINGADVSSPERALEAYARLRDASSYEVRLQRNGAPVTLRYRVVEQLP